MLLWHMKADEIGIEAGGNDKYQQDERNDQKNHRDPSFVMWYYYNIIYCVVQYKLR